MKLKEIVSLRSFWKSVFWLGLSFLVLYNIISMLFEYGGFVFETYFQERTEDGKLFRFLLAQLLAAFLYDFILSFGQFRGKEKKE